MSKSIRPRGTCPECNRSIAVTFNSTVYATLRPHVSSPGKRCPGSGKGPLRGRMGLT